MKVLIISCTVLVSALTGVLASPTSFARHLNPIGDMSNKRDLTVNHPCPLYCDENGKCVCAAEPPKEKRSAEPTVEFLKEPRDFDLIYPCPPICDKSGCVCDTTSSKERRTADVGVVQPCPLVCNKDGCVCDPLPLKEKRDDTFVHPCPLICDKDGCVCNPNPPKVKRAADMGLVQPCPGGIICNQDECVCGPLPPKEKRSDADADVVARA